MKLFKSRLLPFWAVEMAVRMRLLIDGIGLFC